MSDYVSILLAQMEKESQRQRKALGAKTVGDLIKALANSRVPNHAIVRFENGSSPVGPHSYRGYYNCLAFESGYDKVTASEFIKTLAECLTQTFEGYKGGNYQYTKDTFVFVSEHGDASGIAIVGGRLRENEVILITKEIDR